MIYNIWPGCEICVTNLAEPNPRFTAETPLLLPQQTHTANVAVASSTYEIFEETDALITQSLEFAIGVRTADCQPLLMYCQDIRAVAAVHAGWRGTFARISGAVVDRLVGMGASSEHIKVFLGPAVCGDCYRVSPELVGDFSAAGFRSILHTDHLDLAALNIETLVDRGVKVSNIFKLGDCTLHSVRRGSDSQDSPVYPSWRREPGTTVRLISAIRLV